MGEEPEGVCCLVQRRLKGGPMSAGDRGPEAYARPLAEGLGARRPLAPSLTRGHPKPSFVRAWPTAWEPLPGCGRPRDNDNHDTRSLHVCVGRSVQLLALWFLLSPAGACHVLFWTAACGWLGMPRSIFVVACLCSAVSGAAHGSPGRGRWCSTAPLDCVAGSLHRRRKFINGSRMVMVA